MSRRPRVIIPGVPLHITQRGVNREPTFLTADDYAFYRWALDEAATTGGCAVHAYALMTNHVHLLMTPTDLGSAATTMRLLGLRYVRYFNDRYRRTGTLWERRHASTLIDSTPYFFACARYIEMNPVRAGLVADPSHYEWSSCRHNAGGSPDALLSEHAHFTSLGFDDPSRREAYRAMLATELPPYAVAAVRAAQSGRSTLYRTLYREMADAMLGPDEGAPPGERPSRGRRAVRTVAPDGSA